MMTIEMQYDRLLIAPIELEEQKTAAGLVLPDLADQNTVARFGEVMEVGHGRLNANGDTIPLRVKKGDIIMFVRVTNGEQFNWPAMDGSGKWWAVIRDAHIVAVLHNVPRRSAIVDQGGKGIVLS